MVNVVQNHGDKETGIRSLPFHLHAANSRPNKLHQKAVQIHGLSSSRSVSAFETWKWSTCWLHPTSVLGQEQFQLVVSEDQETAVWTGHCTATAIEDHVILSCECGERLTPRKRTRIKASKPRNDTNNFELFLLLPITAITFIPILFVRTEKSHVLFYGENLQVLDSVPSCSALCCARLCHGNSWH